MILFFLCLLTGMVLIIYGLTGFKFKSRSRIDPLEVSLEELASCWIKYNDPGEKKIEHTESSIPGEEPSIQVSELADFYKKELQPYERFFREQNVIDVLEKCLEMLDRHGSVPSVVTDVKDNESVDLISVRDNLALVTLREHTMNVVRIIIDLVKQNYSDPDNFIPQAVIIALAHDIGKIPELRLSGLYNSYDHAIVSSNWLAEQFTGKDVFWIKQAVTAVRDHHLRSKDVLTQLLKKADMQARQIELIRYTSNYEIKPFEQWFNPEKFLDYIEPEINVTEKGKWEAFSFKGIIYVKPECIYRHCKKYMFDMKVIDSLLLYDSEKEEVLRRIVEKLRALNLIAPQIAEPYSSRKFELKMKLQAKKQQVVLVAIKAEPFMEKMSEIESRKSGSVLDLIDAVLPV